MQQVLHKYKLKDHQQAPHLDTTTNANRLPNLRASTQISFFIPKQKPQASTRNRKFNNSVALTQLLRQRDQFLEALG